MARIPPLRVGVVCAGELLHETVVDRGGPITVGTAPNCTLQVPDGTPGAPRCQQVLRSADGGWDALPAGADGCGWSLRGTAGARVPWSGWGHLPLDRANGAALDMGAFRVLIQTVRPGVPVMVARSRRALRVGLVFDGRLMSERLWRDRTALAIGPERDDDIVLPREDGAVSTLRCRIDADGLVRVRLPQGVELHLHDDEGPRALARSAVLRLGERARVRLGGWTVLLQPVIERVFVPVVPRLQGFERWVWALRRRDLVWTVSLLLAVGLVGGSVGQALVWNQHVGRFLDATDAEETHTSLLEVEPVTLAPPEPAKTTKEDANDLLQPGPAPAPAPAARRPKAAPARAERPATVQDDPGRVRDRARDFVMQRTIAGTLAGGGDPSRVAARLFARDDGAATGGPVLFADTSATDGEGPARLQFSVPAVTDTDGPRRVVGIRTFERPQEAPPRLPPRRESPIVVIPEPIDCIGGCPHDPGDESVTVGRVVARKARGVQRCYDAALREQPDLEATVRVRFVVGTAGTVTDVQVAGVVGELESCIRNVFLTTRGLPVLAVERPFRQTYVLGKR